METKIMKCGGCDQKLLLNEIVICKKCELMSDEIIKGGAFSSTENFHMLMKSFVISIAEYQATHRLDFRSTMAIFNTFVTIVQNGDKEYLTLYGETLSANGVDINGNDLL